MDFVSINTLVGFLSGLFGLLTGGITMAGFLRRSFGNERTQIKTQAKALQDQVLSLQNQVSILSIDRLSSPVFTINEAKILFNESSDERGISFLEEWCRLSENSIGNIYLELAKHYCSYVESDLFVGGLEKAANYALLATRFLHDGSRARKLLSEINVMQEEARVAPDDRELERAVDVIEDFSGPRSLQESEFKVEMLNSAFSDYMNRGFPFIALSIAHRAYLISKRNLPEDSQLRWRAIDRNVVALFELERFAESESLAREVLCLRERHLAQNDADIALSLNNIASTIGGLGRHQEAIGLYKKALFIRKNNPNIAQEDVAMSCNNLASSLEKIGNYKEAHSLYAKAIEIDEKAYGPEFLDLSSFYGNISILVSRRGEYKSALNYKLKAIKILEKGSRNHTRLAIQLGGAGHLLRLLGKYNEAKILVVKAIKIQEQIFGSDHIITSSSYDTLGSILREQYDFDEAAAFFMRACAIRERDLGNAHEDTLESKSNLGLCFQEAGKLSEAREVQSAVFQIRLSLLPECHDELITSQNNLALLDQAQGDLESAKKGFEEALRCSNITNGTNHPQTALVENNLGRLLLEMGICDKAKSLLLKALATREAVLGTDHPYTLATKQMLNDSIHKDKSNEIC